MNAIKVVEKIRNQMLASSLSQMEIQRLTGLHQSTISRALKNPVRVTGTHRTLCKFFGISLDESPNDSRSRAALVQTVLDIWDGTPEHAQSIARLLNASATLEAHAASRAAKAPRFNGHRK